MLLTGNDVVDLTKSNKTSKSQDLRFLSRVFTDKEQKIIFSSNNPEKVLWLLWSGKESAYKLISKIKYPVPFSHKKFRITLNQSTTGDINSTPFQVKLKAYYEQYSFDLESSGDGNRLHTIAIYRNGAMSNAPTVFSNCRISDKDELDYWSSQDRLSQFFTKEELASIAYPYSAAVRHDLKNYIAKTMNLNIRQLQIIRPKMQNRPMPPFLLIDGEKSEIDISISHHGHWIGWVALTSGFFL